MYINDKILIGKNENNSVYLLPKMQIGMVS